MLIRSHTTTLLQIFCELLLYSQFIFKSMKVADDTSKSNSECEWVNLSNATATFIKRTLEESLSFVVWTYKTFDHNSGIENDFT